VPLACDSERAPEPTDPRQSPTPDDGLDSIVGFHGLRPIRRGRRPLVISKPPKPVGQMTYSEIDRWAGELVDGMAAALEQ
jgi:hypothetical protein